MTPSRDPDCQTQKPHARTVGPRAVTASEAKCHGDARGGRQGMGSVLPLTELPSRRLSVKHRGGDFAAGWRDLGALPTAGDSPPFLHCRTPIHPSSQAETPGATLGFVREGGLACLFSSIRTQAELQHARVPNRTSPGCHPQRRCPGSCTCSSFRFRLFPPGLE